MFMMHGHEDTGVTGLISLPPPPTANPSPAEAHVLYVHTFQYIQYILPADVDASLSSSDDA